MTNTSKSQTNKINADLPCSTKAKEFRTYQSPQRRTQIQFAGPGLTKQSFKDECDVNVIMKRYQATGILPQTLNQTMPQYADVSGVDFQEAMQTVASAQSMFQSLPSQIRSRFDNDPAKLLDFVQNPSNRAEAAAMGFLTPEALQRHKDAENALLARPSPISAATPAAETPKA